MSDNVIQQLKLVYNRMRGQIKASIGPSFDMSNLDRCITAMSNEYNTLLRQEHELSNYLLKLAASPNLSKEEVQGIMKVLGYDTK